MCIVSFCIGSNYRDLTAASLCVRLLQTHLLHRSPPDPLEPRSMQPVWWWRLLRFSHRETCSHHKGSFAGHTHSVANSRSDVHFISFSSLVILGSGRRNSYELLLLSSSINYIIIGSSRLDVQWIPHLQQYLSVSCKLKAWQTLK